MDFSFTQLMLALVFGSIGLGMFMFGKRTQRFVPLGADVVLMVYPYFVSNTRLLVGIGIVVTVVPFLVRD